MRLTLCSLAVASTLLGLLAHPARSAEGREGEEKGSTTTAGTLTLHVLGSTALIRHNGGLWVLAARMDSEQELVASFPRASALLGEFREHETRLYFDPTQWTVDSTSTTPAGDLCREDPAAGKVQLENMHLEIEGLRDDDSSPKLPCTVTRAVELLDHLGSDLPVGARNFRANLFDDAYCEGSPCEEHPLIAARFFLDSGTVATTVFKEKLRYGYWGGAYPDRDVAEEVTIRWPLASAPKILWRPLDDATVPRQELLSAKTDSGDLHLWLVTDPLEKGGAVDCHDPGALDFRFAYLLFADQASHKEIDPGLYPYPRRTAATIRVGSGQCSPWGGDYP